MKKALALILALLMLAGSLVSCVAPSETPSDTTPPAVDTPPEEEPQVPTVADDVNLPKVDAVTLKMIESRKVNCKLIFATEGYGTASVYSDYATKIFAEATKAFSSVITQAADTAVPASDDALEILIGPTNRKESNTALMFAQGTDGFVIKAIGNKLVINALTDEALGEGVNYFIEEIIGKAKGKTSWTYTSANDYVSEQSYVGKNYKVAGIYSFAPYTIVVPENAGYMELRTARRVQFAIASRIGVIPMIVDDKATGHAADFEILIGNTSRTSEAIKNVDKLEYVVALNKAKIEINAGSIFAFEAAAQYAEKSMVRDLKEATYNVGEIVRVDYTKTLANNGNYVAGEKTGDFRMVVHNIWGWNETTAMGLWAGNLISPNGATQRNLTMAQLYIDLDADVILLQEYTEHLMRQEKHADISKTMEAAGYAQVYKVSGVGPSATPIFYKKDRFELLDSGVIDLMIKYSGCGGDKYMTYAVLKDKESGKTFGAISIHKDYRGGDAADSNRLNMAKDAVQQAKVIRARYGNCPVFVGGDFNCNMSSDPYKVYLDAGYVSAQAVAENTDTGRTYLAGPAWDKTLNMFINDHTTKDKGSYEDSIDHLMFIGDVEAKSYDVLTDVISASIADHMPHVLDFNLK